MFESGVTLTPNAHALPGSALLQQLADGLAAWALIASLIALVVGAALWAWGNQSQNYQQSSAGRRTVTGALVAAVVIGAAPVLINFFFAAGRSVH